MLFIVSGVLYNAIYKSDSCIIPLHIANPANMIPGLNLHQFRVRMLKLEGKAFAFRHSQIESKKKSLQDIVPNSHNTSLKFYLKTAIWKASRRLAVMDSIANESTFDNQYSVILNRYDWLYSAMKHQRERALKKVGKQTLDTLLEPLTIAVYARKTLTLNDGVKVVFSPKQLNTFRLFHSEKEEIDPVATDKVGGHPTTAYAYRVMQMDMDEKKRLKLNEKLELVSQLQQHPPKANTVSHFLDIHNRMKKCIRAMLPMLVENVVDAYNNPADHMEPLCSLKLAIDKWPSEVQYEMLQNYTQDVLEQITDVDGEVKSFFKDFRREVHAFAKFGPPMAKKIPVAKGLPRAAQKFVKRKQAYEVKSR